MGTLIMKDENFLEEILIDNYRVFKNYDLYISVLNVLFSFSFTLLILLLMFPWKYTTIKSNTFELLLLYFKVYLSIHVIQM